MKNKKMINIIGIICCGFAIFGLSYYIALRLFSDNISKEVAVENEENSYVGSFNVNEVLNENTDVILKIRLKSSQKEIVVKTLKVSDLKSIIKSTITMKKLEEHFGDSFYKLESSSQKEIILVKESKFEPNKYYLGTSEGYISIFKCNNEGQLYLEDPLTDKSANKIEILPDSDRALINSFEFEFENKDEALEELANIGT